MPISLPRVNASDWAGWCWPVPIDSAGRVPVRTQEWKPGHDPPVGTSSGRTANHLGVDIMYRKLTTDSPERVRHDASKAFIAPEGTPILCAGPGKIWGTFSTAYGLSIIVDHGHVNDALGGVNTFYQHLASFSRSWRKGDVVNAGDVLGQMGFSTASADGEQLRHLHFELRFPRAGFPVDDWRIDPEPYLNLWPKIHVGDILPDPPVGPRRLPEVDPDTDPGSNFSDASGDGSSEAVARDRIFGGIFTAIMFLFAGILLVKVTTGGTVGVPGTDVKV